jgi:hypothetical protein
VSHFYGMAYREVMDMPVRAFWLMFSNIRRIRAGDDVRNLMTSAAAQSADGVKELQEKLVLEIGTVATEAPEIEAKRDEAGFAELKAMAAVL